MRAGIALGSNLGNRRQNLRLARERIQQLPNVHGAFLLSAVYETDPVGCEPGANKFLNAVLELEFGGDAVDLLKGLERIEISLGRPSDHARNTSREIDLDLLYFGDARIDTEQLQLPHPRMHLRRFVLVPLADIRPELILPGQTQPVRTLLAMVPDNSPVVRLADEW